MVHILGQVALGDDIGIAGVRPVKQPRGRRTRDRLLNAGQKLIRERAFETLSVADIARAAECSVGAFYLRFQRQGSILWRHDCAISRGGPRGDARDLRLV